MLVKEGLSNLRFTRAGTPVGCHPATHGSRAYIVFYVRLTPIRAYIENYVRITGSFGDVRQGDVREPALHTSCRTCHNPNKRSQNRITAEEGAKKNRPCVAVAAGWLPQYRMRAFFFLPLPPL
jgi:hypothetical protein